MRVTSASRCSGVDAMKPLPCISADNASTALIPARHRSPWSFSNASARRPSMKSATPAARAPADCWSVGMMMSLISSTSANSAGVKNLGLGAWGSGLETAFTRGSAAAAAAVCWIISRREIFIGSPALIHRPDARTSATPVP